MSDVDMENLISMIEETPLLWYKSDASYKARIETQRSWVQICKQINPEFEEMSEKERMEYGKYIMKKWTNVRDSFHRYERQYMRWKKSGSKKHPPKAYIYHQELMFLKKNPTPPITDASIWVKDDQELDNYDSTFASKCDENIVTEEITKPVLKKRKPDPVGIELLSGLTETPNRHLSFFKGIIPTLNTFDEDDIVEFQLKVMQILSDMRKSKRTSINGT